MYIKDEKSDDWEKEKEKEDLLWFMVRMDIYIWEIDIYWTSLWRS